MTLASKKVTGTGSKESTKATLVFGYVASTVLLGAAGLLFIPAAVQSAGPLGWASVALGQAFGIIVAVIVGYGWALTGPATIAGAALDSQVMEFRRSLLGRLLISVPATAIGLCILWLLFPGNEAVSGLALLGTAMTGLSSNWLFVGMARPFALLWCETIPRTAATAVAIISLYEGSSLEIGLLIQASGLISGLILTYVVTRSWMLKSVTRFKKADRLSYSSVVDSLRAQSHGMISSLVSVIFLSAPILLVGLIAPSALPAFALADKIQKQFISGMAPLVSVAQGWVPKASGRTAVIRRSRTALTFGALLSVSSALAIAVVGPWLWAFLGAGQIEFKLSLLVLVASICAAIFFERVLSRAGLVPLQGTGRLVMATAAGSILGILAAMALVTDYGAEGALIGVLLGFLVTIGFELGSWIGLTRSLGRRRRNG